MEFKEKEKEENNKHKKTIGAVPEQKEKENESDKKYKRTVRAVPDRKDKENEESKKRKRTIRADPERKEKENEENKKRKRRIRADPDRKEKENEENKKRMRKGREDVKCKIKESNLNKDKKRTERENEIMRMRQNTYNKLVKDKNGSGKLEFLKIRSNMPEHVCCCCEGLFFQHSVSKLNTDLIKIEKGKLEEFTEKMYNYPSEYASSTCKSNIVKGKIPKLATSNEIKFVDVPDCIRNLLPLEDRLCSPYIPFMQVRLLK